MEDYLKLITFKVYHTVTNEIVTEGQVPQLIFPLIIEIHNVLKSNNYAVEFMLDDKVIRIDHLD